MMTPTYIGDIELNKETLAHYGIKGMKWRVRKAKGKVLELRAKGLRRLHGIKDPSDISLNIKKKQKYWGTDNGKARSTTRPTGNSHNDFRNNGYSNKSINSNFSDRTGKHPGLTKDITNANYDGHTYTKKLKSKTTNTKGQKTEWKPETREERRAYVSSQKGTLPAKKKYNVPAQNLNYGNPKVYGRHNFNETESNSYLNKKKKKK